MTVKLHYSDNVRKHVYREDIFRDGKLISSVPSEDLLGKRIGHRISTPKGTLIILPLRLVILLVLIGCSGGIMGLMNDLRGGGLECPNYSSSNVNFDSSDMQRRNMFRQYRLDQSSLIHLCAVTHHRPWHSLLAITALGDLENPR